MGMGFCGRLRTYPSSIARRCYSSNDWHGRLHRMLRHRPKSFQKSDRTASVVHRYHASMLGLIHRFNSNRCRRDQLLISNPMQLKKSHLLLSALFLCLTLSACTFHQEYVLDFLTTSQPTTEQVANFRPTPNFLNTLLWYQQHRLS